MRFALVVTAVNLALVFHHVDAQSRIAYMEKVERTFFQHITSVNLMDILTNKRIMAMYMKCLFKVGVCSPEIKDFRILLPRFLKNLCNKCSEKESRALRTIFQHVRENRPSEWKKLEKIYDPKKEYKEKLERFIMNGSNTV